MEGQAARGPVPPDAARARRRAAQPRRRDRGDASSRRASSSTCASLPARRGAAVEDARAQLLRAPRRRRHRLARALAVDRVDRPTPVVRARVSPVGEGLQVLVYAPDRPRPVRAHLRLLRQRRLQHPRRQGPHDDDRLRARHLPGRQRRHRRRAAVPRPDLAGRDPARASRWRRPGRCPSRAAAASRAACESFPVTPRVTLRPDERAPALAARRLGERPLGPAVRDRARARAATSINLQLAKITTLGERVEDTFLVDGAGAAAEPGCSCRSRPRCSTRSRA